LAKVVEWKFRWRKLNEGTTPVDIKSDAVRSGWNRTVERVSVEGEKFGCKEFRIGYIDAHGVIGWDDYEHHPQAEMIYDMHSLMVLQAGDRLLVRITGPYVDENILAVYAYGYEEKVE